LLRRLPLATDGSTNFKATKLEKEGQRITTMETLTILVTVKECAGADANFPAPTI
jgi:hypothetical protein